MSVELKKQKLNIAMRAGELHKELSNLFRSKELIERKKSLSEGLKVITGQQEYLFSAEFDKRGTALHDLVIQYIDQQISVRDQELDDLIKVLQ